MAQNTIKAIPLTLFDTAGILPGYQSINSPGLPHACYFIQMLNESSIDITISFDGITDHEYIPHGWGIFLPVQSGAQPNAYVALYAKYTQIYVKAPAAGVGLLSLSGYYV